MRVKSQNRKHIPLFLEWVKWVFVLADNYLYEATILPSILLDFRAKFLRVDKKREKSPWLYWEKTGGPEGLFRKTPKSEND